MRGPEQGIVLPSSFRRHLKLMRLNSNDAGRSDLQVLGTEVYYFCFCLSPEFKKRPFDDLDRTF
jgi:hypothetical protein